MEAGRRDFLSAMMHLHAIMADPSCATVSALMVMGVALLSIFSLHPSSDNPSLNQLVNHLMQTLIPSLSTSVLILNTLTLSSECVVRLFIRSVTE
jgi:hypothetical protein